MASVKVSYKFKKSGFVKRVRDQIGNADTLEFIGNALLDEVESHVPLDTGALRASGHIEDIDVSNNRVKVAWDAPYAGYVYEGVVKDKDGNERPMQYHTEGTHDHWDEPFQQDGELYKDFRAKINEYLKGRH